MTAGIEEAPVSPLYDRLWLRLRPVASTGAALAGSYLLLTVIGLATARALGPGPKGQVAAVTTWFQILMWVGTFGLNTASSVRVAETFGTTDERQTLRESIGNAVAYSAVVGTLVAAVAVAVLAHLLSGLGVGTSVLLILTFVALPAGILSSVILSIQLSLERGKRFRVAQIAGPAVSGAVLLGLYVVNRKLTAVDVVVSGGVSTAVVLVILIKGLPLRGAIFRRKTLLSDLRFGGSTAVGGIFGLVNLRLDILALSILVASVDVGRYAAANNVMAPILIAPAAAAAHLTPKIARLEGHPGAARLIFREAVTFAAIGAAGGCVLAVAAPFVVPWLLGSSYRAAVPLIWILVPGFIARGFTTLLVAGSLGLRWPRVGNVAEGAGVLVTLITLPLALAWLGISGAAWASTLAYCVSAVTASVVLWRADHRRRIGSADLPTLAGRLPGAAN